MKQPNKFKKGDIVKVVTTNPDFQNSLLHRIGSTGTVERVTIKSIIVLIGGDAEASPWKNSELELIRRHLAK